MTNLVMPLLKIMVLVLAVDLAVLVGSAAHKVLISAIFLAKCSVVVGQRTPTKLPRRDLQYSVEISLEEAATGIRKQITVPTYDECDVCHGSGAKPGSSATTCSTCHGTGTVHVRQAIFQIQQTCPTCHGTGKEIKDPCTKCHGEGRVATTKTVEVNIPAGIDNGQRIRLSGEGEPGMRGAPAGDLYIHVSVKPHKVFHRDPEAPTDLHCELPISFPTAALGGEVEVPTLDGKVKLSVPAGTQNGKRFAHQRQRHEIGSQQLGR